jgi:hypothetical protein
MKMSKTKEFTLTVGYTYQPAAYHSAKGEASITIELEEGDDVDVELERARESVVVNLIRNLAGVETVHKRIYGGGDDPIDLLDDVDMDEDDLSMLAEEIDSF